MTSSQQFRLHSSVVVMRGDRVLLVQESKASNRGRWNLPGGHVDPGETITAAAERELREETGLELKLTGLIGVYSSADSVRFVFHADAETDEPTPGDEITAVRWYQWEEITEMADEDLVAPVMLRAIADDSTRRRPRPIDTFHTGIFTKQPPVG